MAFIDHIFHVILRRKSAPWGIFVTPWRERLMNDVAILSMLYESTAIVSVNGVLHLYQVTYLQNISLLKLLQEFAIHTSVALVIGWVITGVFLVIETHYQNMAVIAVLRRKWKRHVLVAMTNLVPLPFSTTPHLLKVTVQNALHLETCIWKSGCWQQLSLLKSSHCKFELITIIMGQLSMAWAAPNTSIALIWGRLAPFKVHLCTHIIRKQVSGVRWRFLESH